MKRVFQLVNWLNMAGTESVFMNWYRNIDHTKLQFDFCVDREYKTPLVEEIRQNGGRIFVISVNKGLSGKLKFYWQLYKTLKENGPYVAFQTHNHWWSGIDCLIAKLVGIKKRFSISHYSDGNTSHRFRFLRPVVRGFNRLFVTHRLAVSINAGYTLYGKHCPFIVVRNGIDLGKFAYNPIVRLQKRASLHLENKFVIGHVGRFSREKNHDFLLDIFAEIYKENPQAYLVLVGVGDTEVEIRKKAQQMGIINSILFMGACSDIQDIYQAFDVFVFPSLYEGLGIAAIEAQCSGLPCIMSDIIPKEAFICNAKPVSLEKSPKIWADVVSQITKNYVRKDESNVLREVGFDSKVVGKMMEQEYL